MWEQVEEMLRQTAQRSIGNMAEFLPGLLALIVIFLLAVVIALLARWLVVRALRGMDFDRRAELLGLGAVADWSAVGPPSRVVARAVTWLILLAGLLVGLSALDAALPEQFARAIFATCPMCWRRSSFSSWARCSRDFWPGRYSSERSTCTCRRRA